MASVRSKVARFRIVASLGLVSAVVMGALVPATAGAPATPTTFVSGSVSYTSPMGTNPLREAVVYLIDTVKNTGPNPSGCTYVGGACTIAHTHTSEFGAFSFSNVSTTDSNGHIRQLEVRAYANSRQSGGTLCTSSRPAGSWCVESTAGQVAFKDSTAQTAVAGGALTENILATASSHSGQAFSVFDIVRMAMDLPGLVRTQVPGIRVLYPSTATQTRRTTETIEIEQSDAFDTDPVLHEVGHALEGAFHIGKNPGGQHSLEGDLTATLGWKDGIQQAWDEGFADFFAVAVRQELASDLLPAGVSNTATYTDPDLGISEPLLCGGSTCTSPQGVGEGNELAVARVLDLAHAGFESLPAMTAAQMLTALNGVETLSDAVQKFLTQGHFSYAGASGTQVGETDGFGQQLASQGIAPMVTGPSGALSGTVPPTFTWTAGGTPTYPYDHFVVYFFDASNNPIPNASGNVSAANGGTLTGTNFSWTPSGADPIWAAVSKYLATSTTVRIEVVGMSDPTNVALTPSTGPYPGQGLIFSPPRTVVTATFSGSVSETVNALNPDGSIYETTVDQWSWTAQETKTLTSTPGIFAGTALGPWNATGTATETYPNQSSLDCSTTFTPDPLHDSSYFFGGVNPPPNDIGFQGAPYTSALDSSNQKCELGPSDGGNVHFLYSITPLYLPWTNPQGSMSWGGPVSLDDLPYQSGTATWSASLTVTANA